MDETFIAQLPINHSVRDSLLRMLGNYEFSTYVPKGANGYVFFGRDRVIERPLAIKFYYWGGEKQYHAEPRTLAGFNTPTIAPVLHTGLADEEWAYFVTPHYADGDLEDLLSGTLPGLHRAIRLCEDVVDGLAHLHSERLVHRDLKPDNIFLNGVEHAVIGDFGSVRRVPNAGDSVPASGMTIVCWPPETCQTRRYDTRGDIYQAGLLLFRTLGGRLPENGLSIFNQRQKREYEQLASPADQTIYVDNVFRNLISRGRLVDLNTLPAWVPSRSRRVLRKALNLVPERRFQTATEFLQELQRLRSAEPDWVPNGDGTIDFCAGKVRRRLVLDAGTYRVEKPRGSGWQRDGSVAVGSLENVCESVNRQII